ncbi:MAG: hydrogenase expression/formation protein HypE, partial [Candidatus Thermofonsia Clade 3 bacterium]
LTAGFILEEGLLVSQLGVIVEEMAAAARAAGVQIVAGDTKVVDKGHGDGVYINTSGVGVIPEGVDIRPQRAQPGDVVIVSGEIGLHGVAILSVREGLEFGAPVESDCAPLNGLVEAMLAASRAIHVLRDPTRGGLAATLNEIARAARVGVVYEERRLPVPPAVAAACEMLGMDPVYIANEGKLVAVVAPEEAEVVLEAMRRHPLGAKAAIIGRITAEHPGVVVARTGIGGSRVVDMQVGEQLPRIC